MRGHIGFKIPRYPEIRATHVAADVLAWSDWTVLYAHLTQLAADQLTYAQPATNGAVSQITIDILTYENE